MKIERLKMKINDVQMNLEREMNKKNEAIKVRRKIIFCGFYRYDENNKSENKSENNIKSKGKSSKKSKTSKSKSSKIKENK